MSDEEHIKVYITIDKDGESHTYEINLIGDLIDREISGFSVSRKSPDTKKLH